MILAAAVAFAIALVLVPLFRELALRSGHIDVPTERSSHRRPTPRNGGLAIAVGIFAGAASARADETFALVAYAGAAILAAMAVVDELRELPRFGRLIVQLAVAVLMVGVGQIAIPSVALPGFAVDLGPLAAAVTVLWVVGVVNAYNFMDGANGLAASEAVIAGAALAALMGPVDPAGAVVAAIVAAAAAGFLPWNFPRPQVFMGDAGSSTLGILFAALTARAATDGIPIVAAALPLAPFLADSFVTVVYRMRKGEAFFSTPHRLHFYQRLLDRGRTHLEVTAVWGALAIVSALAALAYVRVDDAVRWILLAAVAAIHIAVAFAILRASGGTQRIAAPPHSARPSL